MLHPWLMFAKEKFKPDKAQRKRSWDWLPQQTFLFFVSETFSPRKRNLIWSHWFGPACMHSCSIEWPPGIIRILLSFRNKHWPTFVLFECRATWLSTCGGKKSGELYCTKPLCIIKLPQTGIKFCPFSRNDFALLKKCFLTKKGILSKIKMIYFLVKERGFTLRGAKSEIHSNKDRLQRKQKAIIKLKEIRSFLKEVEEKL